MDNKEPEKSELTENALNDLSGGADAGDMQNFGPACFVQCSECKRWILRGLLYHKCVSNS